MVLKDMKCSWAKVNKRSDPSQQKSHQRVPFIGRGGPLRLLADGEESTSICQTLSLFAFDLGLCFKDDPISPEAVTNQDQTMPPKDSPMP